MRVQTGSLTFTANAAMDRYLRVKLSAAKLVTCDATDQEIGTLENAVLAADDPAAVVTQNITGTKRYVASAAISLHAKVYGSAGGKISSISNANFVGYALDDASGDGSEIEVLPQFEPSDVDAIGSIQGPIVFDDDFLLDYPANATALPLGSSPWLKLETDGLGVIESDEANGVIKFVFDSAAEAAVASIYQVAKSFDIDKNIIFECRLAIFDIGDDASLDINFGMSDGTHATTFDTVATQATFHLNGNDLSVLCESDDGTIDVAPVDTGIDVVDDAYNVFKIDFTDKADVKFFINDVRVNSGTTYDMSAYTGRLGPVFYVEKSSNNTTADVRLDRVRVQSQRN